MKVDSAARCSKSSFSRAVGDDGITILSLTYSSPRPPERRVKALMTEAQALAGLGTSGDLHFYLTVKGGHVHFCTKHGFPWGDRKIDLDVVADELKDRMRLDGYVQVEVA